MPLLETIARHEDRAAETELRDLPLTIDQRAGPLPTTLRYIARADDAAVLAAAAVDVAAAGSVPSVRADDYSVPAWAQLLTKPSLTPEPDGATQSAPGCTDRPTPPLPEPPVPDPPGGDELRRAAYVLIDRGRSVAQTAAVLNLDRYQVRTWAQMGRW